MLTAEEKWRFDLHGYLLLPKAVPAADVERMVELSEAWPSRPDEELPEPLSTYSDPATRPTTPRSLNQVEYVDDVFQRLILNPAIMPGVLAQPHAARAPADQDTAPPPPRDRPGKTWTLNRPGRRYLPEEPRLWVW